MRINSLYLLLVLLCLQSCDYFKPEPDKIPVARVNDNYLYLDDIESLVGENVSEEDSARIVSNYINRWATQRLLLDQAKINLSDSQVEQYEKLVEDYKNDLFTEAYKNAIVNQQLDSTLSAAELQQYYEQFKENFRLNDPLYQLRYIHVDEAYSNLSETREMLNRFEKEDQQILDSLSLQFKAVNLNDSIWVKKETMFAALPVMKTVDASVLKKSNFAQIQDSLGVYLVKITDVLNPKDIAPLSYVKPTIKEIILNKRKLDLIKKLEKDITKDAVKDNKYEIYKNQ